jgi:plastocyanin
MTDCTRALSYFNKDRFMTARSLALVAATTFAVSSCGGGTSSGPPPVADQIDATASLAFDPGTLTTNVGHTVTFAFGSVGHDVYFDAALGAPADIPGTNANTSITRTFNTAGTFTYTCHIHPFMHGSVVVQ